MGETRLFQCLAFPYLSLITEAGCEKRRKMAMQGWRGSAGAAHCLVCERNPASVVSEPEKPAKRCGGRFGKNKGPDDYSAMGRKGAAARWTKNRAEKENRAGVAAGNAASAKRSEELRAFPGQGMG